MDSRWPNRPIHNRLFSYFAVAGVSGGPKLSSPLFLHRCRIKPSNMVCRVMHDEHTVQLYDNWAPHRLARTYWVTDTSTTQIAYRKLTPYLLKGA